MARMSACVIGVTAVLAGASPAGALPFRDYLHCATAKAAVKQYELADRYRPVYLKCRHMGDRRARIDFSTVGWMEYDNGPGAGEKITTIFPGWVDDVLLVNGHAKVDRVI